MWGSSDGRFFRSHSWRGRLRPVFRVRPIPLSFWGNVPPILYKKVNRNRPNQLFSILSVKIPVAQPQITSPSAYSPLRPDTHSKIPQQGCWDGFRAIRHNALFFQFFFNQCRAAFKAMLLNHFYTPNTVFVSRIPAAVFIVCSIKVRIACWSYPLSDALTI